MPDLPVKTPDQLLVLASIIEKETGKPEERTRVAAVFVNRLKSKMKLQSDPTIIYGLVGGKGSLGRGILKSEISQPTPYNTYVIEGLPPGPIANPGRASIEAAANPARTKELFFVADGTGGHTFSETYDVAPEGCRQAARDREGRGQCRRRCRATGARRGSRTRCRRQSLPLPRRVRPIRAAPAAARPAKPAANPAAAQPAPRANPQKQPQPGSRAQPECAARRQSAHAIAPRRRCATARDML